jgi:hypothetical protein
VEATQRCSAEAANAARVEAVLHAPDDDGPYAFASERHADLISALGLPAFAVGTAFATFERGEVPPDLTAAEMIRSPAAGVGERMLAADAHPDTESSARSSQAARTPRSSSVALPVVVGAVAIALLLARACG